MIEKEVGVSSVNEAPENQVSAAKLFTYNNNSAKQQARKSYNKTLSGGWNHPVTKAQLQTYLDLGLTPIPLKGKIPIVKWLHGNWNPKTIEDLSHYKNCVNWGLKTGGNFAVIDFDDEQTFFNFAEANIENLPENIPVIKTGRGYHIWFRPTQPLKDQHFEKIDIKGEGGQVVAPPSIHPKTGKRYQFIWPVIDDIPELDITKLKFPALKNRSNEKSVRDTNRAGNTGNDNDNTGILTDRPRFDFNLIKDGVCEGERHSTLVSYTGYLIWRGLSKEEITVLVTDWNQHNQPPLPIEEVVSTANYCYQAYAKKNLRDAKNVSNITLNNFNSVAVETKSYPQISHRHTQFTPESPPPTQALAATQDPAAAWQTENLPLPNNELCGKKRAIMRKGREYMSVSFFCGRWSCPRCGRYFRQRWIEHLTSKTAGTDLYVTEISEDDWPRVRRAINRLEADYMKITSGSIFKLITDKPLKDSTTLTSEQLKGYLESAIPNTTFKCPISTSRNWRREKNTKKDSDYIAVTQSWLPVKDQTEVAQELGATIVKHARWLSPKDVDEEEWAKQFKDELAKRERSMAWFLKNNDYTDEIRSYLNQQYVEDAVNDEAGDGDFMDRQLLEVA